MILVQEFLIVATLLTTALHVRIARKITLLNLRRKFMTLDDSKLFAWMRTREDFRDFANSFLDEVNAHCLPHSLMVLICGQTYSG